MKSLLNAAWYILGVMMNVFLLVLTIFFIVRMTERAFEYGNQIALDVTTPKESNEISITLRDGATISEVSKILEDNGIVKYALLYRIESLFNGASDNFIGGTYLVNTNMNSIQINRALRTKETSDLKITIKEGYTLKDIAEYLEVNEIVTAQEFIDACNNNEFSYPFLNNVPMRENRLEGYLFPDTYFIVKDSTPVQIINKMLTRFNDIYDEDCKYAAQKLNRTMDEIIIIASMIEKEIKIKEERTLASSIIYNRLESDDKRLEFCSTIQYALTKRKDRLVDEDLKIESPYNTYLYPGLPIGPICNPGQAAIKAALNPESTDYLYMVLKDEASGEHLFTESYEEFIDAKILYNQKY